MALIAGGLVLSSPHEWLYFLGAKNGWEVTAMA
jgi:hypothetical protein